MDEELARETEMEMPSEESQTRYHVFIVYLVDKAVNAEKKIQILSKILHYCGIDCNIDQYFKSENILSWPQWISQQIESCIFKGGYILLECSEMMFNILKSSHNPTIQMAAGNIDGQTIGHHIRQSTNSFLPFCIDEDSSRFVPASLSGKAFYIFLYSKLPELFISGDFTQDDVIQLLLTNPDFNSLNRLVATVTNQQVIIKPVIKPIGESGDMGLNEECCERELQSKSLTKLKGKFTKVIKNLKQLIESKELKVEDLIDNLRSVDDNHTTIFSNDDAFSEIKTVKQLFVSIQKYCNIYDYGLLEAFLESLDDCDEAIKLLNDFTKDLHHSILEELDLLSESKNQLKPKKLMKGTYKLEVKYDGNETCTLAIKNMVHRVVLKSLHLHKASITFIGLDDGCVVFVYQISAAVKSYILHYKITYNGFAMLALHNITHLFVDGTKIPIPSEFKKFIMQLDKLLITLSPSDQAATLSVLKKIFNNIVQHPDEDKYRQIKLTNEVFSNKVWQYPAGEELMKMSGWVVEGDHVELRNDSYAQTLLAITSQKLEINSAETSAIVSTHVSKEAAALEIKKMLVKQLDKLIDSLGFEDGKNTLLTLQIYFRNIYFDPHNDTYRQIKLNNKAFYSKVWQYPDGEVFMRMSGWEVEGSYVRLKNDSHIQIVLQLLKAKIENKYKQKDYQGVLTVKEFESLTSAVLSKDLAGIDRLLQRCGISSAGRIYCQNGSSMNLLMAAITTQHGDMVELLVDYYDVDPYELDDYVGNRRPCIFQIFHQAPEAFIIEFFSALGFINVCVKNEGFTVVHTAVLTNSLEVLDFLIENFRIIRVNDTDNKSRNSLHLAYLYGNNEMAEFLREMDADETALDSDGKKPSDYISGDPELVAYSEYVKNARKIHDDPYTIEYSYYIQLLKLGNDPKKAVSLTMKEFTWLEEERPTRPRRTDQDKILKNLAEFLIDKPISSVA